MKTKKHTNVAMQLPGALALAAAGATTQANAATVQTTFSSSYISSTGSNNLVTDFWGDGVAEIVASGTTRACRLGHNHPSQLAYVASLGNVPFNPGWYVSAWFFSEANAKAAEYVSLRAFTKAITFSDNKLRGGESTTGYLDLTLVSTRWGEKRITVNRVIFDDATGGAIAGLNVNDAAYPEFAAVPEPSSLGLLALGAGGLLARRRRAQAA